MENTWIYLLIGLIVGATVALALAGPLLLSDEPVPSREEVGGYSSPGGQAVAALNGGGTYEGGWGSDSWMFEPGEEISSGLTLDLGLGTVYWGNSWESAVGIRLSFWLAWERKEEMVEDEGF